MKISAVKKEEGIKIKNYFIYEIRESNIWS